MDLHHGKLTSSSPKKGTIPKGNFIFQPLFFRDMLVFGGSKKIVQQGFPPLKTNELPLKHDGLEDKLFLLKWSPF